MGSLNTAALNAAVELAPAGMKIEICDLSPLPLYNEDLRKDGFPNPVSEFRERIAKAGALLIITPEYNYSIPGVLKNALDWASRSPDSPLNEKPVAILGASPGNFGTVRAQLALRQLCFAMNMFPLNKPEVMIARANEKFDANGRLFDEPTRAIIGKLLQELEGWTSLLRRNHIPQN